MASNGLVAAGGPGGLNRRPRTPSSEASRAGVLQRFLVAGVAAAVLTLFGLYHVWTSNQVVRLGYDLSKATGDLKALQEHNQRLRLEFSSQKRDALRKRQATQRYRLRPPTPLEMFVILRAPVDGDDDDERRKP